MTKWPSSGPILPHLDQSPCSVGSSSRESVNSLADGAQVLRPKLAFVRPALVYTSARILLFVAAVLLLYLVGARGLLLAALALLVSGIASFVVLSRQRDAMSASLTARLGRAKTHVTGFGKRIDEGAAAEDED